MPRKLRIQYPGAIYHVMSRGDQRENIFKDDKDRKRFIHTLASVGSGNGYLRTVCDYVHPNPVRAGLIEPEATLESFPWSSYVEYLKSPEQRPVWLRVDRLLGEKGILRDSEAGRKEFGAQMER